MVRKNQRNFYSFVRAIQAGISLLKINHKPKHGKKNKNKKSVRQNANNVILVKSTPTELMRKRHSAQNTAQSLGLLTAAL
jgi:hypothetical protein